MKNIVTVAALVLMTLRCAEEQKAAEPSVQAPAAAVKSAVEGITSPAGAGAAEPFLFASRDSILLSWLEPVANTDRFALRFARYRNGQWSVPRTIVERNDLFVNWADFPSIVEDAQGVLFAHWLQKSGSDTYSYDVRMATSSDGESWGKPFLLNRDGKKAEHGFVTLAPLPGGGVGATWLDGRNMNAPDHDGSGHESTGDMTIRYAAVSAKGEIAGDTELDPRTCECCTTGMTVTDSGPVIVYRDRSAGEIRDVAYVAKSAKGWSKPALVQQDGWKIAGCPVNGPQIDAIGNRAATAWFTAAQDKGRAFVSFSDDGGTTFAKPLPVDDGKPIGRLDVVLLDSDTALVTWLEQTTTGGEIRARRVGRNGKVEPSVKVADSSTARAAGFARTAKLGSDVYFTWTEQTATTKQIRLARGSF